MRHIVRMCGLSHAEAKYILLLLKYKICRLIELDLGQVSEAAWLGGCSNLITRLASGPTRCFQARGSAAASSDPDIALTGPAVVAGGDAEPVGHDDHPHRLQAGRLLRLRARSGTCPTSSLYLARHAP